MKQFIFFLSFAILASSFLTACSTQKTTKVTLPTVTDQPEIRYQQRINCPKEKYPSLEKRTICKESIGAKE